MEQYAIFVVAGVALAAIAGFMLLTDFRISEKSSAKKHGKRVEQRARFSQIAAAEAAAAEKASQARAAKPGFGRR